MHSSFRDLFVWSLFFIDSLATGIFPLSLHDALPIFTIWGYVRGFHWRNAQGDWLLYENGGERPALQWLIRYVANIPAVVGPQSLALSESAAGGTAAGAVTATDSDAGTVFSQWQINSDPSGKFAIDPATGVVRLGAAASLDFETTTSYQIAVSVWDGYVRSAQGTVTINVTNENDNAPAITAGQSFRIDDGYSHVLGALESSDPDDANQLGFTTFQD